MNKAQRVLKIIERYYDDFGNTGATNIDTAGGVRKSFLIGVDPYPNGQYVWNPPSDEKCLDVADSTQKINITMRPGAIFKKIAPSAIEIKGLTLYVSGTLLDALMSSSQRI